MDELDRILASDDSLRPSAGFTARVMTAAQSAAAEEPPLPFPWGRFALGIVACVASAGSCAWFLAGVDAGAAFEGVADQPGVSEALLAAVVSVSMAHVLRYRARVEL